MTALAQYLTLRRKDMEPWAVGIGPRSVDLLPVLPLQRKAMDKMAA